MAVLSQLFVEFRASLDKFHDDLGQVSKEIRAFDKDMKPVTDRVKEFGEFATAAGIRLTAMLTAPIAAVAGLGISFNAMQEQAKIGFGTMLGSAEKADAFLKQMKDFAAKTPFEYPDLIRASQRLMAMGFSAEQVKPMMESLGNAVAGLGGGAPEINRVTLALGQMQGRGRVATQEMNQLTEVGIPAWSILAEKFHVSEANLRSMVEKGMVPAGKAVDALVAGMNERFPDMMEKQSRSFNGLISTIKDEARFLAGDLTEGLFNALKGPAETLSVVLHDLRMSVAGWSDEAKTATLATAGLAAAMGPLLLVVGQMALGFNQLVIVGGHLSILLSKMGLGLGGITLAGTAAAAAVVLIGAAGGEAIGTFINWTLRVTGLQQAFDGWLASMVRIIPVIGPWLTGQSAITQSTEGLTKAQKQLVAEFASHGVVVDEARLKDSAYLASLAVQAKSWAHVDEEAKKYFEGTLGAKAGTVRGVYEELFGKKSQDDLDLMADKHAKLAAEAKKVEQAWIEMRSAQIQLEMAFNRPAPPMPMPIPGGLDLSKNFPIENLPIRPVGLPVVPGMIEQQNRAAEEQRKAAEKQWEDWRRKGQHAIDGVINDMSKMFIEGIIHGKSFWESFKKLGENAFAGIVDMFTKQILHAFLDPFAGMLGKFLDSLTKKLTGFLTDLGTDLAKDAARSAAGAAGSAAGSVGSAGGGAGEAAGSAAGGVGTAVMAGVSAAGSIGVIMQLKRIEGTMNAVEHNTRYSMIHNDVMINSFFHPWTSMFEWIRNDVHVATTQLDAIYNVLALGTGGGQAAASATPGAPAPSVAQGGGATVINNIEIHVEGNDNPGKFAREFLDYLDSIIMTGQGSYRERWTLAFNQNAGVVSTVPAG